MPAIVELAAREILDSRGVPTIEVDIRLDNGARGRAAAPSGGSRGKREAAELRDSDQNRYGGAGVRQAVALVREIIAPALMRGDVQTIAAVDRRLLDLDGTARRTRLGANAMLAVSMAATRALAAGGMLHEYLASSDQWRLPVPMFNVLNGGAHAGNNVDFQEFMIAPVGASSFAEALRMGVETYYALRVLLKRSGKATSVGDEGGFAPDLDAHTEPLDLLLSAIEHAGFGAGSDIVIAVDAAAGELSDGSSYIFRKSMRRRRTTDRMIDFYASWARQFPIWSIEDGLAESDIEGWRALTAALGKRIQLVGDDLFVTNTLLLRDGIAAGIANAVLIKLNQIGTVSETLEAIQIKAGAPVRGERVAKYNQLLRLEEALGAKAIYAGRRFRERGGFLCS